MTYHTTFFSYAMHLDPDARTSDKYVYQFVRGLEDRLRYKLIKRMPRTLDEAAKMAWETHRTLPSPWFTAMTSHQSRHQPASPTTRMDVDRSRMQFPTLGFLPPSNVMALTYEPRDAPRSPLAITAPPREPYRRDSPRREV